MATNIIINYYNGSAYIELYPRSYLADSATTASSCSGNSATATSLQTVRTIRTNLASTLTASFNGTANITPGVTGILGVGSGGTGVTSYSSLATQLSSYMSGLKSYQQTYTGTGTTTTMTAYTGFATKLIILLPNRYHKGIFAIGLSNMDYYGGIIVTVDSKGTTSDWSVTYNSTYTQFSVSSDNINMNGAIYCYICIG